MRALMRIELRRATSIEFRYRLAPHLVRASHEGSEMANGNHLSLKLSRNGCETTEAQIPLEAIPWELLINLAIQALMAWLATQKKLDAPASTTTPAKPR